MPVDFSEFSTPAREEWLSRIEADLKGTRTLDSMDYLLGNNTGLSPFLMAANVNADSPLAFRHASAGIDIQLENEKEINSAALHLLQSGVDVVRFRLHEFSDPGVILNGINPEHVKIYLDARECSPHKIKILQEYIAKHYSGSVNQFVFETQGIESQNLQNKSQFFLYQTIHNDFVKSLRELYSEFRQIASEGKNAKFFVFLNIHTGIPGNIAFIRALKIIAVQLGIHDNLTIALLPDRNVLNEDKNIRLIQLSYITFIGMTGGADVIMGLPVISMNDIENARLTVNMVHIFKEEAKMDKVSDPFAGSYFIEEGVSLLLKHVLNTET